MFAGQTTRLMEKHALTVTRTAHYYRIGHPGPQVHNLVLACHGYGQAAERFIRKFEGIADERTLVLAPEGLSRFYWGGFDGEVVASWMTRGDRLDEIADYTRYLTQLLDLYLPQCAPDAQLILFGFSQGCATIMRWAVKAQPDARHLVFWAGSVPEDIDYTPLQDYLSHRQLHAFFGDQDPFLTPELIAQHDAMLREKGLTVHHHPFSGKHTIVREVLHQWYAQVKK